MSGSAARGRRPARGGTSSAAACPAARGCKTYASGGTHPFEEAKATGLLLDRKLIFDGGIPVKKADGRMDIARACC